MIPRLVVLFQNNIHMLSISWLSISVAVNFEVSPERIQPFLIFQELVVWLWYNLVNQIRRPYWTSADRHSPTGLLSQEWDINEWACVLRSYHFHNDQVSIFTLCAGFLVKHYINQIGQPIRREFIEYLQTDTLPQGYSVRNETLLNELVYWATITFIMTESSIYILCMIISKTSPHPVSIQFRCVSLQLLAFPKAKNTIESSWMRLSLIWEYNWF